MKRLSILLLVLGMCLSVWGQDMPAPMQPPRMVNDFTGLLSPDEQNTLEQKLRNYHDTTSTQIYVVTIADLGGYDISDYASRMGDKWGIGQKDKNNGILILIKPKRGNERGEIKIEVGYGMEGVLPDAYAKRIIEQIIVPYFSENLFYEGLDKATTAIMQYAAGEYQAEPSDGLGIGSMLLVAIVIVLIILLLSKVSKGGGGGFTGGFGGGLPPGGFGGFGSFGGGSGSSGGGFSGGGGGRFGGGGARGSW